MIVIRKRLIMPRKEDILPGKRELLLKDQVYDAQIVSIHIGG